VAGASTAVEMRVDLVERARHGDREAFGQLAGAEVDRLVAIARLILRDPDLAEDAAQEALVRCWRQLPRLRDVERFDGWLYRILVHAAADESKRRRRFEATVQIAYAPPETGDDVEAIADRQLLEQGFRRLSVDHRAVVVLHHYLGLPLTEIAATLGIPTGTAKSRYHYAMSALRAALDAEGRMPVREEVPA
jgi:RNA polymerase sigma-70 factor (ECF subfamily)